MEKQIPSLFFSASLIFLTVINSIIFLPPQSFCSTNENLATCLRDWLNAGGNILTAAIALAAALFAWKSSSKQSFIAALPSLREQLKETGQIHDKVLDLRMKYRDFLCSFESFNKFATDGASLIGLTEIALELERRRAVAEVKLTIVAEIGSDLRARNNLESELKSIIENGWVGRASNMLNILDFMKALSTETDSRALVALAVRFQRLKNTLNTAAAELRQQELLIEENFYVIRNRFEFINQKIGLASKAI